MYPLVPVTTITTYTIDIIGYITSMFFASIITYIIIKCNSSNNNIKSHETVIKSTDSVVKTPDPIVKKTETVVKTNEPVVKTNPVLINNFPFFSSNQMYVGQVIKSKNGNCALYI